MNIKNLRYLVGALLVASFGVSLAAQERFALVIGNGAYVTIATLKNPTNDATDMAAALKDLGFKVVLLKNAGLDDMETAVVNLGQKLGQSPGAYGFFFYAGHGVQSNGANYLIPVDADIKSEAFLRTKTLAAQEVLDTLQQSGNGLNVVVLDACRDNPFGWARGANRGLTVVGSQPPGSIIAYATSVGSVAQDGTGRNGLFTSQLLKNLKTPGLEIKDVFNRTGADVMAASDNKQVPAVYSQFFKTVYLAGAGTVGAPNPQATPDADWGEEVVTPGGLSLSVAYAATVEFNGKSKKLPAGASVSMAGVVPGDYPIKVSYVDGHSESRTIRIEPGQTVTVVFSYKPAPSAAAIQSNQTPAGGESSASSTGSVVPRGWTTYTTANGLGGNTVNGVTVSGSAIYAGTDGGLSISVNGGASWTNYTTTNGLGDNKVRGVAVAGSTIYAATDGGLSISVNGGASWTTYTTTNGLGDNKVRGVAVAGSTIHEGTAKTRGLSPVSGSTIYAATDGGLSISVNGGASWTTYTTTNGLGDNKVRGVAVAGSTIHESTAKTRGLSSVSGSTIYAATWGGLSVSTNGGASWTTYTTANGLGSNQVAGVAVADSTVYAATWGGGLSVSADGGASWTTYTITNGIGSNYLLGVAAAGSTIYAATWGGGLSVSADGGASWTTYTETNGLGFNYLLGVAVSGSTIYAATDGGLSVSY